MKKMLIVLLVLLFMLTFIRIATSTYENIKRRNNEQMLPIPKYGMTTNSFVLT